MLKHLARTFGLAGILYLLWLGQRATHSQEPIQLPPMAQVEVAGVPNGIEVLARGPVHEAFATPTSEAKATPTTDKKPPPPLEEMPPDEKPDGDVAWIAGYWAWDDDRQDYLWVSGCWRIKPQGKDWVPGYWREQANLWQWVPGFWTSAAAMEGRAQDVTYYPEPPAPPQLASPGDPPSADMIHVPGHWYWVGNRYLWRTGYWTRARAGFVYVPSHYRWTPFGHVFVSGYWDFSVARRGVLYAPVVVDPILVGPTFVYTPYYAVSDTIVLDALFVHPGRCHYYFGDFYGPRYRTLGYESCVVYSRRHYDPIVVHRRWEHRDNPRWLDLQINVVLARDSGRAPLPPRTLVQQNTIIQNTSVTNVTNVTNVNNVTVNKNVTINNTNNTKNVDKSVVLSSTKNVLAARGAKSIAVDATARTEARESAKNVQQVALQQRQKTEVVAPGPQFKNQPKVASMAMPVTAKTKGLAAPAVNPNTVASPTTPFAKPPSFTPQPPLVRPMATPNQQPPLTGIKQPQPPSTKITPPSLTPSTLQKPTPVDAGKKGPTQVVPVPAVPNQPVLGNPKSVDPVKKAPPPQNRTNPLDPTKGKTVAPTVSAPTPRSVIDPRSKAASKRPADAKKDDAKKKS